jgi:hypothetical protein
VERRHDIRDRLTLERDDITDVEHSTEEHARLGVYLDLAGVALVP